MADPTPRPSLPTWVQGILPSDSPFRTPDVPPPPAVVTPPRQARQPPLTGPDVGTSTPLTPEEEPAFRQWIADNQVSDLDHPDSHYDYRGFWRAHPEFRRAPGQHLTDDYKQPGHETFSQESTYSRGPSEGGMWVGPNADTYLAQPKLAVSHALQPPQQAAQPPLNPPAKPSAWEKAQTIGPPKLGEHYPLAGLHELLASDNPARLLAGYVVGPGRPSSVAAADPYGIVAAEQGKGPMPIMVGATAELPQAQALVQGASKKSLARLAERFPAFATDFAKHTTGETLPPALGHLADVLIQTEQPGVYALKPEVQARIAHFLEEGKSVTRQANWRGSTSREILKAFDNDPELADIWARMVGATSPSTEVPRNTKEAVQGMRRYLMTGGKPFTEETLTQLPGGRFGVPASKFGNMNRAQLQEALSGDKVDAFAQLMRDHDRIPLDRHAIYALGGVLPEEGEAELARHLKPLREFFGLLEGRPPKYKVDGDMYGTLNKREAYERVEQALADTLRTLDPDRPLKDVFAQMWEGTRMQRGGEFQGGPIDLMGPRGLLQRGAMTDPKQMLKALRMNPGKNWLPKLAALAALGGADAARTGAPPADAAQASPGYSDRRGPLGPLAPPPTTRR